MVGERVFTVEPKQWSECNLKHSNPKWSLFRVLQLLLIGYLVVALAALIFQRRMIYFPTKIPADVVESVAKEHGFVPWKNPSGAARKNGHR